ncbi:MAG: NAD(+) diphosphatase [Verrucomicrobia bacterium]|nr:NAD(+) diphosphatase [Verrucomicrobiota bacterium]
MSFVHCPAHQAKPAASDICLVIQGDRLLAVANTAANVQLPVYGDREAWREISSIPLHVGLLGARPLWLYTIESADALAPVGWEWHETRALLSAFTPAQMHAVSCARELNVWQSRNRFCGCCGTPTIDMPEERAKKCPACSSLYFPNISPAVIVAVTRGDQILLGHNRNFRPGMFSLLAGFIDPGETAEQAVTREVREEVGIEIGGLHYITSQPWPFPNSLMLGFRAHHVSGEVVVDGKEIEQAGWFTRETLPEIPRVGTVARLIIDGWLRE